MTSNDIPTLRINYELDGWERITEGWTKHNVVSGSILAINSLCDEVEQLRAKLAEKDAEIKRLEKKGALMPSATNALRLIKAMPHSHEAIRTCIQTLAAIDAAMGEKE